jgi:hypothetical protein
MTVSLARIMYGTNEDVHAADSRKSAASSSLTIRSAADSRPGYELASAPAPLGEILHKAWAALHHKD